MVVFFDKRRDEPRRKRRDSPLRRKGRKGRRRKKREGLTVVEDREGRKRN
jgi:hypothetical protein